jgi:hypothetical protein
MEKIHSGGEKPMKMTHAYYRVNPGDICFIRYVFEALDGLAVITTVSPEKDTIVIRIAPGCEEESFRVIEGLKAMVALEERIMETEIDLS